MLDIQSVRSEIKKQLAKPISDISIVALVDLIVEYAYIARASDVHIEPAAGKVTIRFRIDGVLRDIFSDDKFSKALQQEIISRIKVLSGLRTDEHSVPQDGKFKAKVEGSEDIDIRVSIMPTYYGENAVLRLLVETQNFNLEDLGFSPDDLEKVERAIKKPYGMILANGPTGSGKSTTLYTILKKLNIPGVSIITIEDPIEYSLEGATQIQVNPQAGLVFASGLRSILRQDPNIIMVGEIRDQETASISVNAALTGHLLLSTLHTNDSATTFPRLIDMGVPPFLVASTINVAMSQRLVRRICPFCKAERLLSKVELNSLSEIVPEISSADKFYVGKGCAKCDNSGYQGRIGIREVLEVNDEIRKLIMVRASAAEIKEAAVKNGMTTMIKDGIKKSMRGETTIDEILRVVYE
ncbi:MAG: GspE/PulE family protein [Patescibacteria group bacterium]|nr:GspE/PulE family protein [Patescibacteria group bacterium]